MKQTLKNYLKLGILLFGIPLTLTDCESDNSFIDEQVVASTSFPDVTYFSRKSAPENVLSQLNRSITHYFQQKSKDHKNLTTTFGTILTDRIMLSINAEGIENYTFSVEFDDNNPKTFYNLVLRKNLDSTFSAPYLKKYTMSDSFYGSYANGTLTINNFEGTYENYPIDETIDIDILLGKSSKNALPCIVPIETTDDGDIGDGNDGDSGDGNNNTTGSGGSTGNSGTGTGTSTGTGSNSGGGTSVTCTQRLVANICNGGGGHYGDPSCMGSFQGSIQLITTCTDGTVIVQDLKSDLSANSGGCPNDSGSVGVMDTYAPPCKKLKQLSSSQSFQQRMQELLNNTSGNTEISYWGRNSSFNGMEYANADRNESNANEREIRPNPPASPIDSYIHNHSFVTQQDSNGNDITHKPFDVFSGADLYTVFHMYDNGLINDLSTFVIVLATPGQSNATTDDDTIYAITISNTQEFINVANAMSIDPLLIDYWFSDPENIIHPNISTELNEKRLAKLLKNKRMGMELYRGNKDDLTDWTRIKVKNNGNVEERNCN